MHPKPILPRILTEEEYKDFKTGQINNSNSMSRIEMAASIREKSIKIANKLMKAQPEETQHLTYCPICYTNVIDSILLSEQSTVRFD